MKLWSYTVFGQCISVRFWHNDRIIWNLQTHSRSTWGLFHFNLGFNLLNGSIMLGQLLYFILWLSFSWSLFVPDHPRVFATTKILSNYIRLSHYTPLSSPSLGDNRGIHHTISCRRFYKLSKMLHRGNSNYRLLHYTLKYALCLSLCVYVCLHEWWWYCKSCSLLMTDDAFPRAEEKNGGRWRHLSQCCHPRCLSFCRPLSVLFQLSLIYLCLLLNNILAFARKGETMPLASWLLITSCILSIQISCFLNENCLDQWFPNFFFLVPPLFYTKNVRAPHPPRVHTHSH